MKPWLTIVLIGLAIIVYTRLFNHREPQTNHAKIMASLEESLEQMAIELEDDNERLLGHVLTLKQQTDEQNAKLLARIERLEKQLNEQAIPAVAPQAEQPATHHDEVDNETAKNKLNIRHRYSELFKLYDAGKSMDYIAKKCEINKGEVQLILQLGKREEQSIV